MEKHRERWYEREEVKKITADWIKMNCKLTERERELIQIVYDRKLVRRDHLEVISPSYRNLTNRTVLLNRAIKKMYKSMIFDKAHEKQEIGKGSNPAIIAPDRAASVLLGVSHKKRIIHKTTKHNGQEYISRSLPSNYRHIQGVNRLEVETILYCQNRGYDILEWKLEQIKAFFYNEDKIVLIPDILVALRIDGRVFVAFIEYDTGSEGIREIEPVVIRDKIIKYKRYKASKLWHEEEWQGYFDGVVFPMILFVTENSKRVEFWNRKCKEYGVVGIGMVTEKYIDVLDRLIEVARK